MQVFVAGATGFIGNATCRALVKAGHEVTGLARSSEKAARLKSQGLRPVVGNLEEASSFVKEAGRPEALIHLAAPRFAGRETLEESERIGSLHARSPPAGRSGTAIFCIPHRVTSRMRRNGMDFR